MNAHVLRFAASVEQLQTADGEIDQLAERQQWPPELHFKVKLVVEEIGLNIINHGYDGNGSGEIEIGFDLGADFLTINIVDEGKAFDPLTESPDPDTSAELEDRPIGGLGVHLVKEMMDEVSYKREGNRNQLTLKVRLAT